MNTAALAQADLQAGRITETAKIVVIAEVQRQIDEYDVDMSTAMENVADEFGVRFLVIFDIAAHKVRD
jgi:hypothetical protein